MTLSFRQPARCAFLAASLVATTSFMEAGQSEVAALQATLLPGLLEIETDSVALAYTVEGLTTTGSRQVDAVRFNIVDVVINDLNGDGLGWRLTANPEPLWMESHSLELGTIQGFANLSETDGLSMPSANELLCSRADAVAGLSVDYGVSYSIPAFAPAGVYQGRVTFSIIAE